MINWFLHHLLHVTSIAVSTSHHKIEELLNKTIEVGTLLTEQASYIDCCWVTMLRNILTWTTQAYTHKWQLKLSYVTGNCDINTWDIQSDYLENSDTVSMDSEY